MNAKVMIDTNILVYAYDRSQEEKQKAAVALLQKLVGLGAGVISTQRSCSCFSLHALV